MSAHCTEISRQCPGPACWKGADYMKHLLGIGLAAQEKRDAHTAPSCLPESNPLGDTRQVILHPSLRKPLRRLGICSFSQRFASTSLSISHGVVRRKSWGFFIVHDTTPCRLEPCSFSGFCACDSMSWIASFKKAIRTESSSTGCGSFAAFQN